MKDPGFAGIHRQSFFNTLHLVVWPIVFILVALLLWIAWIGWVRRGRAKPTEAS